ncbi:MAG: DUF2867 domain-containing protein [Ornithinimicrobium sp.]
MADRRALVTGATGYIGSRLVPQLLLEGWTVRVLSRSAEKVRSRPWHDDVEISEGSADDAEHLASAMADVDVAYYFIHSMDGSAAWVEKDKEMAELFATTAREQGVSRIVYLSGLYPRGEELSTHLGSRKQAEDIFIDSQVPAAVLRAAVILGAGSASFEMMRHLTDRLPVMIAPRWLSTNIEPIAIRDVVRYLVGAADLPPEVNRGFDIGAGEVLTYKDMIDRYAAVSRLAKRRVRTLPVMTPGLASHWVGLVTPVPAGIAKPLVGSLIHEVICKEHDIAEYIPDPEGGFLDFEEAVRRALSGPQPVDLRPEVDPEAPSRISAPDPEWAGMTVFADKHHSTVHATVEQVWSEVEKLGGGQGWHVPDVLWRVRGLADRIVGGVGHRPYRDPGPFTEGMQVDSWVVERLISHEDGGRELHLRSRMKTPGKARMIITVTPGQFPGTTEVGQQAQFTPVGLAGLGYWGALWLGHKPTFAAMHRGLTKAAERAAAGSPGQPASR